MPIDRIPILTADYPLFDWDDYPLSYYALGQGELVSGFQKETWNAIIDETLAALRAAGMSWDSAYTSAANAKVTQAYGPLSAKMFNSVRHNLDCLTPIGWGWAKNPNMRGYVGRNDFNGYADYGLNGDLFYAEYLLELVRRLNLTLSIMRGTANLSEMEAPVQSLSQSIHGLISAKSAPMEFSEPAFSSYICGIRSVKSGSLQYKGKSTSKKYAPLLSFRARRMGGTELAHSSHKGKQAAPFVKVLGEHQYLAYSLSQAAMEIFNCIYLSSAYGLSNSNTKTTLLIPRPYRLQVNDQSTSIISATSVAVEPQPIQSTAVSKTDTISTAKAPGGMAAKSNILSKTDYSTDFDRLRPRRLSHQSVSQTNLIAYLDSAWYAPIWVNGKLYIRQAYETNLTDATLEVK